MTSAGTPARAGGDDRARLHGGRPLPGLAHGRHVAALPLRPEMALLVGRRAAAAAEAADRLGWQESTDDWRAAIARDDIDVVDICTPGDTHAEMAIAALAAGKHVLCEKPLANTVAEAEAMVAAARTAPGRQAMVGFTYRRTPAVVAGQGHGGRRAFSGRSGRSAPSTCRTGSPTRRRR